MTKIKKNKLFILTIGTSFIVFSLLYMVGFHLFVNKDMKISHSYKHFLLKHTSAPRLIIDSGSNSFHAINSKMLEKEFGQLTLNLSDSAGYPLKHKLLRIEKYSSFGDIVLLPLEWQHYGHQEISNGFLQSIFDQLNYYYNDLSWIEKIKLMLISPLSNFINLSLEGKKFSEETFPAKKQREYTQLVSYEKRFKNLDRGDAIKFDTPDVVNKIAGELCQKSVLDSQLKKGFYISDAFKDNIKIIKRLQKKGIEVFFIWPAVVGDNCYQGKVKKDFDKFVSEIKKYMLDNNIPFLSEPEKSNFQYKYLLNTHYHVIPEARDIRTKNLIKDIKNSKVFEWFKVKNKLLLPRKLSIKSEALHKDILESLNGIKSGQILKLGSKNLDNNVFLMTGWLYNNDDKVWSQGESSLILIKLGEKLMGKKLKMVINSYHYKESDKSKTKIIINGEIIGNYLLNGRNEIIISEELTKEKEMILKIEFNYTNVKSPFEYGDSQDRRKFKLWVGSLMFLD